MAIIFLRDRVGFALLTLHKIKVLFVRIDPPHTIVVGRARIAEATNRSYENDIKKLTQAWTSTSRLAKRPIHVSTSAV